MATLAIKGHPKRGNEVIEILEMLGGRNLSLLFGDSALYYAINREGIISTHCEEQVIQFSLEEFLEKFPYKVGDKVTVEHYKGVWEIIELLWSKNLNIIHYGISNGKTKELVRVEEIKPYKEEAMEEDKGNISDGYHTFNELYEYRLLYNASMFNELAKQGLYDVHKSKKHSDGTIPFDDENWFIVQAELPTGQISNHYEMKDWDLFNVPEKEKANQYDGHTPQDVAKRLRDFLTIKNYD